MEGQALEEALRREQRCRVLFDSLKVGYFEVDLQGRFLAVNAGLLPGIRARRDRAETI